MKGCCYRRQWKNKNALILVCLQNGKNETALIAVVLLDRWISGWQDLGDESKSAHHVGADTRATNLWHGGRKERDLELRSRVPNVIIGPMFARRTDRQISVEEDVPPSISSMMIDLVVIVAQRWILRL